jgi:hypothetical protein
MVDASVECAKRERFRVNYNKPHFMGETAMRPVTTTPRAAQQRATRVRRFLRLHPMPRCVQLLLHLLWENG